MPGIWWIVAKLEIRAALREGGITGLAVLLACICGGSAFLAVQRADAAAHAREAAQSQARLQWERQGDKDPHSAAHFGIYALKPMGPWHWFDPGVDPFLGTAIFIEAHRRNTPTASSEERRDWQRLISVPTPAAILQALLPLLAIVCGCSAIAAERESGILRQALSAGMAPRRYGLGSSVYTA